DDARGCFATPVSARPTLAAGPAGASYQASPERVGEVAHLGGTTNVLGDVLTAPPGVMAHSHIGTVNAGAWWNLDEAVVVDVAAACPEAQVVDLYIVGSSSASGSCVLSDCQIPEMRAMGVANEVESFTYSGAAVTPVGT